MNIKNLILKIQQFYFSKSLIWLLFGVGIFLRLRQYAFNRSLWSDEAVLGTSLITRSFSELLLPLEGKLVVPVGFLMSEKLAVQLLGPSEYALRFLPLASGILAIFLFYKVIGKLSTPAAAPLALGIFAVSGPLVYFSSEAKQYSFDVLMAVVILLLAVRISRTSSIQWTHMLLFGLWGAATVWFSHPAVFLLAGAASVLVWDAGQKRKAFAGLAAIFGFWLVSFIISYLFSKRYMSSATHNYLNDYWQGGFMPLVPTFKNIQWYVRTFFMTFENPGGFAQSGLAAFAFCAGIVSYLSQKKTVAVGLLIMPIVWVLLASALRKYPFSDRLIVFIVPLLILVIAEGAVAIKKTLDQNNRLLGGLFLVLLLIVPVMAALYHAVKPMLREELRPVVGYLKAHIQLGDTLYIYDGALRGFRYYSSLYHFTPAFVKGVRSRGGNAQEYLKDFQQLEGKPRVWLLFSHVHNADNFDERQFIVNYLETVGKRLDGYEVEGNRMYGSKGQAAEASVYLYDLSKK